MELIFCLGVACVYVAAGIIAALGMYMDLADSFTFACCVLFWPAVLFIMSAVWVGVRVIEWFRRK